MGTKKTAIMKGTLINNPAIFCASSLFLKSLSHVDK